jgi:hypothetical protein
MKENCDDILFMIVSVFTFAALKMSKATAHQRLIFKVQNTIGSSLDLELSIFFKIFEFYHDPVSLNGRKKIEQKG